MDYRWNHVNEDVLMTGPKFLLTEFVICHRLESCALDKSCFKMPLRQQITFCVYKIRFGVAKSNRKSFDILKKRRYFEFNAIFYNPL